MLDMSACSLSIHKDNNQFHCLDKLTHLELDISFNKLSDEQLINLFDGNIKFNNLLNVAFQMEYQTPPFTINIYILSKNNLTYTGIDFLLLKMSEHPQLKEVTMNLADNNFKEGTFSGMEGFLEKA